VLTDVRTQFDPQFSTPKPAIKLQVSSIALPEHDSKESRIKLGLHGFTLNIFPNMKRIGELVSFAKPPPGVSNLPVKLIVPFIVAISGIRVRRSQRANTNHGKDSGGIGATICSASYWSFRSSSWGCRPQHGGGRRVARDSTTCSWTRVDVIIH
jgi:hypothetical protein